jgi:hypothetical protein
MKVIPQASKYNPEGAPRRIGRALDHNTIRRRPPPSPGPAAIGRRRSRPMRRRPHLEEPPQCRRRLAGSGSSPSPVAWRSTLRLSGLQSTIFEKGKPEMRKLILAAVAAIALAAPAHAENDPLALVQEWWLDNGGPHQGVTLDKLNEIGEALTNMGYHRVHDGAWFLWDKKDVSYIRIDDETSTPFLQVQLYWRELSRHPDLATQLTYTLNSEGYCQSRELLWQKCQ